MKYIIGLDLGINNVGYSVIDAETKKIIKKGVRLYNIADAAEDRRILRNTRRRIKRRKNRIQEVLKLFESINFPSQNTIDTDLLAKRIKGLAQKLDKQEIVNIVCYFMSHRGYIPFGDEERDLVELNGKLPCQFYDDFQHTNGKFRALENVVKNSDLRKELIIILEKQSDFYPELKSIIGNDDEGIINIFNRKRKFWEGPGSINSYTPYGRFKDDLDVENYIELKNSGKEKYLFEDLIGHCKIYSDEKCVPRANFHAEKFNLLNDIINIKIINIDNILKVDYVKKNDKDSYKLTTKALEDIIDYCLNYDGTLSYTKVLKEVLGLTKKDIMGYRKDKNDKPLFSLFNSYRYFKKIYLDNNLDMSWLTDENYKNYNKLIAIFAVSPGIIETTKMIQNLHKISDNEMNVLKQISDKFKKDGVLQYHALSEKALIRANNDMLQNCLNFMQVSQKFDYNKDAIQKLIDNYGNCDGRLYMTTKYIDDIIASPQVKKTLRQAINIINAIIKEQNEYPYVIAVESTSEMNGNEKKKEIDATQKRNEKLRQDAIGYLEKNVDEAKITPKMVERVMLYKELNEACPYCGKPLNINDVINDIVEIEHILPISQSADDSQNNKTLSCRKCNDRKGNKTPYGFLTENEFEEFTKRILNLKIDAKKRENFLTTDDINKYKIRFFHRNLNDTAYATKELISQIKLFNLFLKSNLANTEILTLSTPGQLTHNIRKQWNLDKNRDDGKYHHAVDASIVGGIATTKIGNKIIRFQNDSQYLLLNKQELKDIPNLLINFSIPEMKNEIFTIKSDDDINISMQVNKDINKSIANANIYSFIKKEDNYFIIEQIDDIYSPDLLRNNKKLLDSLFDENDKKYTLLCQEKDPKLFDYLKNIYLSYQHDNTNPFLNYCEEMKDNNDTPFNYLKDGIKTPSKNNKGVLVKRLRYMRNTNDPFLLDKKNIKKKQNTLIGLDSVSTYCTKLYWDNDLKKIIFFPIYTPCVDFKNKTINKEHSLYKTYYQKLIEGKNVQFVVDLFNGQYIEIEKSNGELLKEYVKGYSKSSQSIQCKSGKYLSPKDTFTLYDVDILGNKHKRLTWPQK